MLESEDMVACNTEDSAKHDECFNVAPQHSAQVGVLDQQEPRNPEPRAETRAEEAVDSGTSFAHVRDAPKSHTKSFCGATSDEGEAILKSPCTDCKEQLLAAVNVMSEATLQTALAERGLDTLGDVLELQTRLKTDIENEEEDGLDPVQAFDGVIGRKSRSLGRWICMSKGSRRAWKEERQKVRAARANEAGQYCSEQPAARANLQLSNEDWAAMAASQKPAEWGRMTKGQRRSWYKRHHSPGP